MFVTALMGAVMGLLPKPMLTLDQVWMMKSDNVAGDHPAPGLDALGVSATPIEAVLPAYLDRYREGGRFSLQRR